jgi:hypothetical protein
VDEDDDDRASERGLTDEEWARWTAEWLADAPADYAEMDAAADAAAEPEAA